MKNGFHVDVKNQVVHDMAEGLMEKLTIEAFKVAMVSIFLGKKYYRILSLTNIK